MSSAPYPITPLDAALLYGVMGWRVAPVRPESKVPAITDWVNAASTDEATIRGWWESPLHTKDGVCIITGKSSGLWVLDVDISNGKLGLETLKALVADHGALPETLVARTPSGGYHYLFRYPDDAEIHNSASNRLGPGLDVRGDGGQINAAPTKRTTGSYRWADGRGPYDAELVEAPDWLLELVVDQKTPMAPMPDLSKVAEFSGLLNDAPSYVTRYNEERSWDEILIRDGWTLAQVDRDGVQHWARPGKDEREGTSATVGYAGVTGMLYVFTTSIPGLPADRGYDRWGYMVHRDFGGDFKAAGRQFAERTKMETLIAPQTTGAKLPTPVVTTAEIKPQVPQDDHHDFSRYELLSVDFHPDGSFWNDDLDERQFLIEPFIAKARGHVLYAEAKSGKSYVVLQAIAAAVIPSDRPSWVTSGDDLTILYLDYEMTNSDLRERLEEFGYTKDDDFSRFRYIHAGGLGADLDSYAGGQDLLRQAVEWNVDLVVIDTLSRAISGEENDADTVRDFYRFTGNPLKDAGIALLRVDHAGKDKSKGARGTSAKNDDVDVIWRLTRTESGVQIKLDSARIQWLPSEINLCNVVAADETISFVRTDNPGFPAGTSDKVALWLKAELPDNATQAEIRAAGIHFKTASLGKLRGAVREARERDGLNDAMGTVP